MGPRLSDCKVKMARRERISKIVSREARRSHVPSWLLPLVVIASRDHAIRTTGTNPTCVSTCVHLLLMNQNP